MDVRGLHLLSGLPRTINVRAGDIREAMIEPLNVIVEAVKRTLERTPPELAADIVDLSLIHISEPRDGLLSRMPSSA